MIAALLVINALLVALVLALWVELRDARQAIGRLNSAEWWK